MQVLISPPQNLELFNNDRALFLSISKLKILPRFNIKIKLKKLDRSAKTNGKYVSLKKFEDLIF